MIPSWFGWAMFIMGACMGFPFGFSCGITYARWVERKVEGWFK